MGVEVGSNANKLPELLNGLDKFFVPFASKAVATSLEYLKALISPYPPQPARDRSGSFNTYVRGVGFLPRSAFSADASEPGGYKVKRKKTTVIRATSEQMDKRYRTLVGVSPRGVTGILRNEASYSGWVIGSKNQTETPHQVPYHTETGWPNKDDTFEQAKPFIDNQCEQAINDMLASLTAGGT